METPNSHVTALPMVPGSARTSARPDKPRLKSQDLLGQHRELEIDHGGQIYRLRLTSLGKLILTK